MKNQVSSILLATVWVSLNEFTRNQLLLLEYWEKHYQSIGQSFPAAPTNGAVWGLWALLFSFLISRIASKFTMTESMLLAWILGFVLMWLVIGNLGVLPTSILPYALPWSMFETAGAVWICMKFQKNQPLFK